MNARILEEEMAEWEEVAALEIVEVIVIEMIEDQDKIEDSMAVIAIEEETLTEDPDQMIGIDIMTDSKIVDSPWTREVTDQDLVQETTVWENITHMAMTMEEITEVPVTSMVTDAPSVMIEVTEDNIKDMMIETSKDHQEAVCLIMIEESLISEEDIKTGMTEEEMTEEILVDEAEEVVSMMKDQESSEMVFASIASKKVIKPMTAPKHQMVVVIVEEVEVIEVASDTVVEEETSMTEAEEETLMTEVHQWEKEVLPDMMTETKAIGKTEKSFLIAIENKQKFEIFFKK